LSSPAARTTRTNVRKAPAAPGSEDPVGVRLAIRSTLLRSHADEFGCETAECGCSKHLRIDLREPHMLGYRRVRFIVRIESMVNVGCKFGPNDLAPEVWEDLIIMGQERQYMDRLVALFREQLTKDTQDEERALSELRKEQGLPGKGGSLFSGPAR
jgi:hypothetical protein